MEDKYILSIISSLLLSIAFPKPGIALVAYIALVPFIIDLHQSSPQTKKACLKGITFAFPFLLIQHLCLLPLIDFSSTSIIIFAWITYSFILSLYWGILAVLYKKLGSKLWMFPLLWIILEFVKTLGPYGNSIGQIANTQSSIIPIAQLSWLGGPFLLSFFVVSINTLLTACFFEKNKQIKISSLNKKNMKVFITLTILSYIIVYTLGTIKIKLNTENTTKTNIAIIQANHSQKKKLDTKQTHTIQKDYINISQTALNYFSPSILFFPETITPKMNLKNKLFIQKLTTLAKKNNVQILIGTPRFNNNNYFNSIALINSQGVSKEIYDKVHLFPFGEYWPYKKQTKWLGFGSFIPENDFTPANKISLLRIPTKKTDFSFGTAICLESMYPWHLKNQTISGATILLVAANHAWFKTSSAAQRHLNQSILRAIENNRFLVQSANTGISSIINPNGTLQTLSKLNVETIVYGHISPVSKKTPYHYIGDSIVVVALLLLGFYRLRFFNNPII